MASGNSYLDEMGMVDLARKTVEDLRKRGISQMELKRLENLLREGKIGEALLLSTLLRTILDETTPEASQKKLLQLYRALEECCGALVELSCGLFDMEVWQHYRAAGYENFEAYCAQALGIPAGKIQALKSIKDQRLPRSRVAGTPEFFSWLFCVADRLAGAKGPADL